MTFNGVHEDAGHLEIEKKKNIAFGQGLFTLTEMAKQNEWGKVQMVRWACWSLLSSTDPNNIGQI